MTTTGLTFGEYLRRLRRAKPMSLHALSEATGLSYPHLSRLENDSAVPKPETVARIADALDGDLKEMLRLADCLPEAILERMTDRALKPGKSYGRRAGRRDRGEGRFTELERRLTNELEGYVSSEDADVIGNAVARLIAMDADGRDTALRVIQALLGNSSGGDH